MRYSSCSQSLARDFVVHEHDEAQIQRLSPAHDDLSVDQPIVDAIELNGHRLALPCTIERARGPSPPRAAPLRAAGTSVWNTKSSSVGEIRARSRARGPAARAAAGAPPSCSSRPEDR